MRPHQGSVEGKENLPRPAGPDARVVPPRLLGYKTRMLQKVSKEQAMQIFFHTVSVFAKLEVCFGEDFPGALCASWLQCQLSEASLLSARQRPRPPASGEPCLWLVVVVCSRTCGAGENQRCGFVISRRKVISLEDSYPSKGLTLK